MSAWREHPWMTVIFTSLLQADRLVMERYGPGHPRWSENLREAHHGEQCLVTLGANLRHAGMMAVYTQNIVEPMLDGRR